MWRVRQRIAAVAFAGLVAVGLTSCNSSITNSSITLDPTSGPEHSIVTVHGSGLVLSAVIWDAGLPSETKLSGGFLSGSMFSVPPGATLGGHPVAIENQGSRSSTATFTVTASTGAAPAPRIDHVMLVSTSFDGSGNVTPLLLVQGPNFDVGAVVEVDGAEVATVAFKTITNDLSRFAPCWFAYPIYRYVAVQAAPGPRVTGTTISLIVRNLDGQRSGAFPYPLPANEAKQDSDGDGLPDAQETGDLGTDPHRRDILVEIDTMSGLSYPPIPTTGGIPGTFDTARAMFAAAPIINLSTENGINLILDTSGSGTVPFAQHVGIDAFDVPSLGIRKFSALKEQYFDNLRRDKIYHYAIWAHSGVSSGESDYDPPRGGDDFVVSIDDYPASFQTLRSQVETLVHELGHNLGQRHGGDDDQQYKPNYWSVMTYTWQLRTGRTDDWRRNHPTCPPAYYAIAGTAEPNGALPPTVNAVVDYSEGMAPNDFANWRALVYNGPVTNGRSLP